MNKKFLAYFIIILFSAPFLQAQTTAILDSNFEDYLETHTAEGVLVNVGDASSMGDGVPNNNTVLNARINNVTSLNISNLNITDITGIAGFTSLETLICSSNKLTLLNVSNNGSLKTLLCGSNLLTGLSLNNNTNLETLNCSNNQIQNLDLTNNTALKSLSSSDNQLSQINLSANDNLTFLNISNNRLSGELIVSSNTNLETLICASNRISILNVSSNSVLKNLDASNNSISNLDLNTINTQVCPDPQTNPFTLCQGLASVNVSNNQLVSLNIANGYNDLISKFNSENNPDLFCIQLDSGFMPPSNWLKDDWTYYSETICTDMFTYVPDANFEAYLETNGLGDDIPNNNFVLTSRIKDLITLNIPSENIDDLTGIEDFVALQNLDCSDNNLSDIDLSNNINLQTINCSNNTVSSLDFSNNTALTTLDCSNTGLTTIDLTANINLDSLIIANNALISLNVAPSLIYLDCSFNQIENLDVSTNTILTTLLCNDNNLFALNIQNGQNANLINFDAQNNTSLVCIQADAILVPVGVTWAKDGTASYNTNCGTYVPDNNFEAYLEANSLGDGILDNNYASTVLINAFVGPLDISGLGISDLTGIEAFIVLQNLDCSDNVLTSLDLSNNTLLQILNCSGNQIENLDVTLNTALTSLSCNDNLLFTLNIRNGNNTNITAFDATNNSSLFCINTDNAIVGTNPAGWLKDAIATYNADCNGNRYTPIPDNNFEQALIDLGLDSGPLDNQVLTAKIEHLLTLNVNDKQIDSLIGIKDFKLLQELDCSSNYLNDLNVSDMVNLEALYCSSNYFLTNNPVNINGLLNTSGTASLTKLFCASNNLNDLNTSINPNLEVLDCADNNLITLNILANTQLKELNCSNNDLTVLDISTNITLEEVNCSSNKINDLTTSALNNATLTKLICANNELTTLLINNYTALTDLSCGSNALTQLNTNSNTALENLDFTSNQITDVDFSNNTNIISIEAGQNELTQLVLTPNNGLLENLNCDYNNITQLLVNNAPLLEYLSCSNNQLSDIDVSGNFDLIELNVSTNTLTDLILSNDLNQLKIFNCSNNVLQGGIDLSTMGTGACPPDDNFCPDTITINVSNNQLEFLNIKNGMNTSISNFNANNNPDLSCIQVDDENNIGASWLKDATAQYSADCRFGETYVPDDNFELALIALGYDLNTIPDDYVPTAAIEILTDLNISGENISDLTGIEDFTALVNLDCSDNNLTTIDLSDNINLEVVNCSANTFSSLDFGSNITITSINCSDNSLSDLDLVANTNLIDLDISNNLFTVFDASEIPTLQIFNCDSNQLLALDFNANAALTSLSCQSNVLETLNIKNTQNVNLASFNAQNNTNLTCIETDNGTVPGGVSWLKDTTAEYAIDCHYGETYVPDDAFENALITLGLDSGTLDDYVKTANIENISYLDIGNEDISDLTGIEAFISLINLNFESNTIANVDLSNNVLLQNLNASNNVLTEIDVSYATNLKIVDISNNTISQLNLDSNLSLLDLNVSNNTLTELNVGLLVNLEILNCSTNVLEALDVALNPNLKELDCQFNSFIQDKLNIQNGANANLERFTASNNPDLACILVDDPFTVISNTDGAYDNWFKDATANYQTICEDADNDGIANTDDQCPSTPFGNPVDLFGCPVLNLPNNNFTILITSETCLNNNNGKINIATIEYNNYTATLSNDNFYKEYRFTNEIDILDLLAGTYQMCITIEEWPGFETCYDIVISQPEPLEVISSKNSNNKKVSLNLSGSSSYNIDFNGLKFSTNDSEVTLSLKSGANAIKVSTDIECQGVYNESIFVSDDVLVFPNPFENEVKVYLGSDASDIVSINMYSYLGQLVYSKTLNKPQSNSLTVDTADLSVGFYSVSVETKNGLSTFKIIKK